MGVRKGAIMPRRKGKMKRKRRKTERSGAWESEKEHSCPAEVEKRREKEENHGRAGHERKKSGIHALRAGENEERRRKTMAERGMGE